MIRRVQETEALWSRETVPISKASAWRRPVADCNLQCDACLAVVVCRQRGRQQRAARLLRAMESSEEDTELPGHRRPVLTQEQERLVEQLLAQVGSADGAALSTSWARFLARWAQEQQPALHRAAAGERMYPQQPHCFMLRSCGMDSGAGNLAQLLAQVSSAHHAK